MMREEERALHALRLAVHTGFGVAVGMQDIVVAGDKCEVCAGMCAPQRDEGLPASVVPAVEEIAQQQDLVRCVVRQQGLCALHVALLHGARHGDTGLAEVRGLAHVHVGDDEHARTRPPERFGRKQLQPLAARPSSLVINCGKQLRTTSSTMLTEVEAPGDAPRRAEIVFSGLVMTSVP